MTPKLQSKAIEIQSSRGRVKYNSVDCVVVVVVDFLFVFSFYFCKGRPSAKVIAFAGAADAPGLSISSAISLMNSTASSRDVKSLMDPSGGRPPKVNRSLPTASQKPLKLQKKKQQRVPESLVERSVKPKERVVHPNRT